MNSCMFVFVFSNEIAVKKKNNSKNMNLLLLFSCFFSLCITGHEYSYQWRNDDQSFSSSITSTRGQMTHSIFGFQHELDNSTFSFPSSSQLYDTNRTGCIYITPFCKRNSTLCGRRIIQYRQKTSIFISSMSRLFFFSRFR